MLSVFTPVREECKEACTKEEDELPTLHSEEEQEELARDQAISILQFNSAILTWVSSSGGASG